MASETFVEIVADPPGVADVFESNFCRIHPRLEWGGERAIVFAAIDNLWKGAAGQAVQNLNLMLGLDEAAGLFDAKAHLPRVPSASSTSAGWICRAALRSSTHPSSHRGSGRALPTAA